MTVSGVLDEAAVIICAGPGGVGKTTAAAALGVAAARRGRRAIVVTVDPARRLGDALGMSGGLGSEPQRVAIDDVGAGGSGDGELWAMMLDTTAAFTRLIEREAPPEQAARIVDNVFFRNMVGSLSGTQEFMAAETLHELAGHARFDLVIVDTPPTRNALDFLEAPGVLVRFIDHKLFRLIMLPARSGMRLIGAATQPLLKAIGRVVGNDVLSDVVMFFQAFAGLEGGFRRRADEVSALLRSERTRYVLVTSPRADALAEVAWFGAELREQGVAAETIVTVLNRATPAFGDALDDGGDTGGSSDAGVAGADDGGVDMAGVDAMAVTVAGDARFEAAVAAAEAAEARAAAAGDAGVAAAWANLAELRRDRRDELAAVAAHRDALGPLAATIPLLAGDVHDREGLAHVAAHLVG